MNIMRNKFLLLALSGFLYSCQEEGSLTRDVSLDMIDNQISVPKKQGVFVPASNITVNGGVSIFSENSQYKLRLVDFSISSGPDLKVYLSKSNTPTEFVNLGNLNALNVYIIPKGVDLTQYPFVLIHCQQYNHLFAVAELTQN
jgi:hypothetical protein